MSVFRPGENCWRVERAAKAAVIIDACDYYRTVRQAMLQAKEQILIIGWDFDPRIALDRDDGGEADETLGAFLLRLAKSKPDVDIRILKWDFGALKTLFRGSAMLWIARLALRKNIRFKLDGAHPSGCSHHQKIVVIDDSFAVCGGIDMTADRWDRRDHADDDPGRMRPNGKPYGPWHDATMVVQGPVAGALGDLARRRWQVATGQQLPVPGETRPLWPDTIESWFEDVELAVARTNPCYKDNEEVREIEALFLDLIAGAERFIYAESQYFASPKIAAAVRAKIMDNDTFEFVLVNPVHADGWLEQVAMDSTRARLGAVIGHSDPDNRFRIYTPVTKGGTDIYVHAKIMIVDDRILKVGSANMNNRSLGLDTECDLALDASDASADRKRIAALRTSLMAEHLGVEDAEVEATFARNGSLVETIEALRGEGKTLKLLEFEKLDGTAKFIADTELLDPESSEMMFEGFTDRSLWSHLKTGARRFGGRKERG
ncbi:phospholipase [Sphingomonas sabuli]|uniref:Phospholipase D n=1 Tax=Sphingomonas sabuli TaxID=2764186 RepID=A0A7G9L5H3_9SPHN|nr:phospholipase D-like domain-containing protein [Sphingomonas sabuli]QNM83872.1 phospholipase [Sphingomonas sabuli]